MTIPSVVTADEVFAVLVESPLCRPGIERGEVAVAAGQVALMFAERTAAAVAAERACWESALADERSGRGSWGGEKDRWRLDAAKHIEQVAAANRVRGQSEVPALEAEERAAYWRRTVEVGRVEDDRCYVGPGGGAPPLSPERLHDVRERWLRDGTAESYDPEDQDVWRLLCEVERGRAREARVQALVEAAEGVLRWLDTSTGLPSEIALRAALDALGKEGA